MSLLNSINTNAAALIALQSLNRTSTELNTVTKRLTTGFVVADAVDDGAAFAVAQQLRSDIGGLGAVNQQLSVARGVVGVALEAATLISETVIKARDTITRLADTNLNALQRSQYESDLSRLVLEIQNFRDNAIFNGTNLLDNTVGAAVISNFDGDVLTITGQFLDDTSINAILSIGGQASTYVGILTGAFESLETLVLNALNSLGGDSRRLVNQITFNTAQLQATEIGLGAIVDSDLARESARLSALQARQQLGIQTLGIANSNPERLLQLFQ